MKPLDIECPYCGDPNYESYRVDFDREWITVLSECLNCNGVYQINYRAVGIDKVREKMNRGRREYDEGGI